MTWPGHGHDPEPSCDQLGPGQRPEHAAGPPSSSAGREREQGHGHGHGHSHGSRLTLTGEHSRSLIAVMLITITVAIAEAAGAWVSGALVLLADAAHMAADAAGVGLSLLAVVFATRPATPRRTFGYARAEILAAMVNAVILFAMSVFIVVEAVRRLISPPAVESPLLVIFGVIALAANAISLLILRRGQAESLNIRGAFLEVASDAVGAAAVIVTGIVIAATGFTRADPIASLLVGALILPRTWRLLADAINVLLEASPRGVDLSEVRAHLTGLTGVRDVHDLHAWTITSGLPVLSVHVVVEPEVLADGRSAVMLDALQDCLRGHFDVGHSTFQLELAGHADHERPMHQ
ncbi:MAG TPA: cation diffusion facilitator family transporter [Streptosporangiaceae bacterium]|nr:cation diffusion facilitator family transporter [Streptosporangiaceae bacterium]HUZ50961.1 cation diffusion facilitator family transporter [Streptosporangiaceae bacterium]